jgi:hypothetical protein
MEYNSNWFYGINGNKPDRFQITEEDILKIKSLKSHRSNESGYYDVMLQWRLSDNNHIVSGEELSRLFVCMQFISMCGVITDDFIKTYNNKKAPHFIEEYHKFLLRRLYLEFDDYQEPTISMGFKRPFGNSHVMGDIREEIDNVYKMTTEEYESDNYEKEEQVLIEFIDFLEEFYKGGFEMKCNYFNYTNSRDLGIRPSYSDLGLEWGYIEGRPHSYLMDWNFDKSEIRNNKIEEILK